jgi:hypothetical protein
VLEKLGLGNLLHWVVDLDTAESPSAVGRKLQVV